MTAVQNKIKQVAGNINNISLLVIDCNTLTKETSFFLILQSSLKNQDKGPFGGYSSWKSITKYYFSNPCFFIYLYFVRIQPSLSRKNLSSPCNTSALDWSPACTESETTASQDFKLLDAVRKTQHNTSNRAMLYKHIAAFQV